ncbi:MAG TPA: NAD(P)/FAD-dependent oxidoreductase [Bryobacteraceae bacterium]|nr:NAD(P)/FAD-dependent oxidoreductase [Bryobacteraceae bacterium]
METGEYVLEHAHQSKAVVIGSGPNGLTAAIMLARAGYRVTVLEASQTIGGGARSAELTLPGFVHDVCSAAYPMGISSPAFELFPLARHGLEWVHSPAPLAHPLDDGTAVLLHRSLESTASGLATDGDAWRRLFESLSEAWPRLRQDALSPVTHVPRHPLLMAKLGWLGMKSAHGLAHARFRGSRARALFAGIAAHAVLPLEAPLSSAIGVVFVAAAHSLGWPIARGGAQKITDALAACLGSLGGEIRTGVRVTSLPKADVVMCDLTPRQFLAMAGDELPNGYRRALERYRYGPGVFKMDWALDGPIPWRAADCALAATVHVGGGFEEIAEWEARFTGRPFLILVQPSLFDATRAPEGKHTAWAYCHVPNGSTADYSEAIEQQVERFAPGFGRRILARHVLSPAALERHNANLIGGDVSGGAMNLRQFFLRPTRWLYRTPIRGVHLCSSSTPPGGGVHGMCGYHASRYVKSR